MSHACASILVGVVSLVLEIPVLSKTAKFSFRTMVIKKFSSIESAQKIYEVGIDAMCMYTNFGGRGISDFEDTATLKNGQISLSDHGL